MKINYRIGQKIIEESRDTFDEDGTFVGREITSKVVAKTIESRRYHMVFVDFEDICFKLSHSAFKIITWIAPRCEYETGVILLGSKRRAKMVSDTGVGEGNVYKYLRELVNFNILIKEDAKEYRINPMYLWRGSLPSNTKAIKDIISEEVGEGLKGQRGNEFL